MKYLITIMSLLLMHFYAKGQLPQAVNFQGVARGDNGRLIKNTVIGLRLTIIDRADGGKEIYREKHSDTTDAYGFFSLQVGRPLSVDKLPNSVDFEDIPWLTGDKFLDIEFDTTAGQTFPLKLGTIEMVTVPFAFAAESVTNIHDEDAQKGDVLVFDGANWVPGDTIQHAYTTSMIDEIGVTKGDLLQYDGNKWVPGKGALRIQTTSLSYKIASVDDVVFADASSNDVTLTLPNPVTYDRELIVRLIKGGNNLWVQPNGSERLLLSDNNHTDSIELASMGEELHLLSDGVNWQVRRMSKVYVKGNATGNQVSVPDISYTPIPIGNELNDNYNAFDEKKGRFTCPKGQSGRYHITISATLDSKGQSWDHNEFFYIYCRVNSKASSDWPVAGYDHFVTNVPQGRRTISGATTINLGEGEFLDLLAYSNLGGTSYVLKNFYFTIERIGG